MTKFHVRPLIGITIILIMMVLEGCVVGNGICGKVVNSISNKPIAGATVQRRVYGYIPSIGHANRLDLSHQTTITDDQGNFCTDFWFSFSGLVTVNKTDSVVISAEGYTSGGSGALLEDGTSINYLIPESEAAMEQIKAHWNVARGSAHATQHGAYTFILDNYIRAKKIATTDGERQLLMQFCEFAVHRYKSLSDEEKRQVDTELKNWGDQRKPITACNPSN